jgi:hypothetical protein
MEARLTIRFVARKREYGTLTTYVDRTGHTLYNVQYPLLLLAHASKMCVRGTL